MNRVEELELTVQLLCDHIEKLGCEDENPEEPSKTIPALDILACRPCSCAELPFPHKRTRACFRRY